MSPLSAPLPTPSQELASMDTVSLGQRIVDVSLKVTAGERMAIVGPNGAGKSSLLRLWLGLERPEKGRVCLAGREVQSLDARTRAKMVSWLPQRLVIPSDFRAIDLVMAPCVARGEAREAARAKAQSSLTTLAAQHLASRYADTLSGGELQRILLASLLTHDAPLVLADEPANHLDPFHQAATYQLLGSLSQTGKTMIVVTHDLALISLLGLPERTRILGLSEGRIVLDEMADGPNLPAALSELFRVPVERTRQGALALCYPGAPK